VAIAVIESKRQTVPRPLSSIITAALKVIVLDDSRVERARVLPSDRVQIDVPAPEVVVPKNVDVNVKQQK
jgi:hypothetical protein